MTTKHERILAYIETLPVGEKISVRLIAKNLKVSEGTAYRAIKEAENSGLVSTIQRVGTIRIERKMKESIETLCYGEIIKIIEGDIFGGKKGLNNVLTKFIIGAMKEDAIVRYITPGSLMIVGNRESVQKLALESGAAVLVTGGFETSDEIIELANELALPLMGTSYDSFTVATMINRAMTDQLIKKEIILVEDIYTKIEQTMYLNVEDIVLDYRRLNEKSGHTRFPVVGKNMRLVGIVAAKDMIGKGDQQSIDRVMTKDPTVVKTHVSVASVGHLMIWDELEVMPVVEDNLTLMGIISRQDVMKAMQLAQRQPQIGDTISDQIQEQIELSSENHTGIENSIPSYKFSVTPQMTDSVGTISFGVLSEIITSCAKRSLLLYQKRDALIEQMDLHYFKMIQLESILEIKPKVFEIGRRSSKFDIEVYVENVLVAKAIVICQMMQRN
ncbi:Predicted transcriptional regulator containing CBS domains [Carnobacterium iners]|uniref:Predicted transcriptional regulator containing CBS domains n=1 Tax=Carnobacterium iners TaxID=1073423 RepID=A0A1X7NQM5_9LACT|nr:DRTGG domain-containing protein [Carnobacterium iners]SEK26670.1 Predicted transcriptional regulator containing CBS domains [Carnobacterium iners]SMH40289.1 Predicted transcriptional regulator containing CBS domains [Carnobacterium iners]